MGFTAMLLRLVGQHPEQVGHKEEFKKSLNNLEEQEKKLDALLVDIQDVDQAMREKSKVLNTTAHSMRPPHAEQESRQRIESEESVVTVEEELSGA